LFWSKKKPDVDLRELVEVFLKEKRQLESELVTATRLLLAVVAHNDFNVRFHRDFLRAADSLSFDLTVEGEELVLRAHPHEQD